MRDFIEISPVVGPIAGEVTPPGSKSLTNRALICAALADGPSRLTGALDSDDTRVMIQGLRALGIAVQDSEAGRTLEVRGCGGRIPSSQADLFTGNSGTTMRFLAAVAALGQGTYRLDGVPRMRQRPIGDLLDALRQLGAEARSEAEEGFPPVRLRAAGLAGGTVEIAGQTSSQFLSGLLMAAPCARGPVTLRVRGPLVSQPYVRMTLAVMRAFGVEVPHTDLREFFIVPAQYKAIIYPVEPDASAASYFFAAAAITGGQVTVRGLSRNSLQGDVRFCDLLEQMGCRVEYEADAITVHGGRQLRGIDADMNDISDTVPTLAAVALFAAGATTIRGVAHVRHKETDRIEAVAAELRKLGATVEVFDDGLRIVPGTLRGAEIFTYDDHRMAMSLALVGLRVPGVRILDPGCTAKTYPQYFDDLAALCGR